MPSPQDGAGLRDDTRAPSQREPNGGSTRPTASSELLAHRGNRLGAAFASANTLQRGGGHQPLAKAGSRGCVGCRQALRADRAAHSSFCSRGLATASNEPGPYNVSCPKDVAEPTPTQRVGAGEGIRTLDIQLGKLTRGTAECPLQTSSVSVCPLQSSPVQRRGWTKRDKTSLERTRKVSHSCHRSGNPTPVTAPRWEANCGNRG